VNGFQANLNRIPFNWISFAPLEGRLPGSLEMEKEGLGVCGAFDDTLRRPLRRV
jgi:hypothetical protein